MLSKDSSSRKYTLVPHLAKGTWSSTLLLEAGAALRVGLVSGATLLGEKVVEKTVLGRLGVMSNICMGCPHGHTYSAALRRSRGIGWGRHDDWNWVWLIDWIIVQVVDVCSNM